IGCGLSVILLRRGLNPVRIATEACDVQVGEHHLVLGVILLKTDGELGLFKFAVEAFLRRRLQSFISLFLIWEKKSFLNVDVLHELHGQSRATTANLTTAEVAHCGAN